MYTESQGSGATNYAEKYFKNDLKSGDRDNRKMGGKKVKKRNNLISTIYANFVCDYF